MHIIPVAIDVPLHQTFSYVFDNSLANGQRVLVEFRNKKMTGFVWNNLPVKPIDVEQKLKPILEVYPEIIPDDLIRLIRFCSIYYHYPIGSTVFSVIPRLLKQAKPGRTKPVSKKLTNPAKNEQIQLNSEQVEIANQINQHLNKFHPAIVYGVTGSGKTELYLQLIKSVLDEGKQALVLVPEINLTPQILDRFKSRFCDKNIVILTSQITVLQRYLGYLAAQNGEAQIVIGTRLSVFTPFANLGLIIVDEEHDQSFKQNDSLRYHARDLAMWRAKEANIPIILGSATPSLESLYNYKLGRYHLYRLTKRAVSNAVLPKIELVDLNRHLLQNGLTNVVLDALEVRLQNHELSMIFLNRRGYSPVLSCYDCGWVGECRQCSTTMVYHSAIKSLKCHHCAYTTRVPHNCPKCNSQHLLALGEGTQKIEAVIKERFPEARVYRIDQDTTTSKKAWDELYTKISNHEVDILVGTQMLAKGHDFHNLTLVVGLNIDNGLYSYDFRASELLFTQLTQVSGRSGRGDKPGVVMLQTRYPEHDLYQYLIKHDFSGFINYLLLQRKSLNLPPYTHYTMLRASGNKLTQVMNYLNSVVQLIQKIAVAGVNVYPVVPSVIERLNNKERAQVLIQSDNRNSLHSLFLSLVPLLEQMKPRYSINFTIDIDPYEI